MDARIIVKHKRMCGTNKEALRWCIDKRAAIIFGGHNANINNKKKLSVRVFIGKKVRSGNTVIEAVNKWIEHFNKEGDSWKRLKAIRSQL